MERFPWAESCVQICCSQWLQHTTVRGAGQGGSGAGRNGGSGEEKAATAGGTELKGQEERILKKGGRDTGSEGAEWRNVL